MIQQALFDPEPENRRVVLPLASSDAARQNMNTLRDAILELMRSRGFVYNGADTIASVYIMDLASRGRRENSLGCAARRGRARSKFRS